MGDKATVTDTSTKRLLPGAGSAAYPRTSTTTRA